MLCNHIRTIIYLQGKETSMNPLGMVDALLCAMNHAATLALLDVEGRLVEKTAIK